tara:strand:- start:649 stop:1278 length:630 start_codon:yes stop_codon:yes gene_type:complete
MANPNLTVKRGQLTFDAEGNDIETSPYFSRVIHWPGNSNSGVTIGRGYDIGNRTTASVENELIRAGIPARQAKMLASGAGLKGLKAKEFVNKERNNIKKITHSQQLQLFNNIYPTYEKRAEANYVRWTMSEPKATKWESLNPTIKDVLVDFVYQGFTKGPRPMKAGMNNDFDELIDYIRHSTTLRLYEPGRNRVKYLEQRKNKATGGVN